MLTKANITILLAALLASTGCASGEHLSGPRRPAPQPAAAASASAITRPLSIDGGARTARLDARLVVQPTFREILSFPEASTLAATYRFTLKRGQSIDVAMTPQPGSLPLTADVFEVIDSAVYREVFRSQDGEARFSYTAARGGEHVLRLQPPAGSAGRYEVKVDGPGTPSLGLPVLGMSLASIAGLFGDARDGGARSHEGVDIFAERGTPVIAVSPGVITSVDTTPTGGRVVWQRDEARGLLYYYAHLEEHRTEKGRAVQPGDTIGTVGNSGNARGSSPHLHFGIFTPGYQAEDPGPYLTGAAGGPLGNDVSEPPRVLGSRIRLGSDRVRMRASPHEAAPVLAQLSLGTDLTVFGYLNGWTRVALDDGRAGFVAGWLVAPELRAAGSQR